MVAWLDRLLRGSVGDSLRMQVVTIARLTRGSSRHPALSATIGNGRG